VVIPQILRKDVLAELHKAHIGIVKMKSVARIYVWWPSMNEDIECCIHECMNVNMPTSKKKSCKSTQSPKGCTKTSMGKSPHRFCWAIQRPYVVNPVGCFNQMAGSNPNVHNIK